MNRVILSLGSNIPDRIFHLKRALQQLEEKVGVISQKSSVYETEAIGFTSDIPFYNMCIEVETALSPESLLKKTQEIEFGIGRNKKTTEYYESRKIDIDIILYGTEMIQNKALTIPHMHYTSRKFVLIPLCELNKLIKDPSNNLTACEILQKCTDNSNVELTDIVI